MDDSQSVKELRQKRWKRHRSSNADERTPLLRLQQNSDRRVSRFRSVFVRLSEHWVPAPYERDDLGDDESWRAIDRQQSALQERSFRRRVFLFLTDPSSSFASAVFFAILVVTITLSNVVMILQTMSPWQYTPTDCVGCGGTVFYSFDAPFVPSNITGVECVCPPTPLRYTMVMEDSLVAFFMAEWALRVLFFEPPTYERVNSFRGFLRQWLSYLTDLSTVIDALAIFPYFIERTYSGTQGLLSLRLLRLFRVFPLLRLGQFNATFQSLLNVLAKSVDYLRLLVVVLVFGAAFFGSMTFYLERGTWKYFDETEAYQYVRYAPDGVTEEISPFTSIPQSFWWFLVTATTVGYGDLVPTTPGGKFVASFAMLLGVLVIAFPVSVFSDLWSKELAIYGAVPDTKGDSHEETRLQVPQRGAETSEASESGEVSVSVQDMEALALSMKTIEENQKRIFVILQKYQLNGDDDK